jgi:hypothetical protein
LEFGFTHPLQDGGIHMVFDWIVGGWRDRALEWISQFGIGLGLICD